jgi:hypothetical protein
MINFIYYNLLSNLNLSFLFFLNNLINFQLIKTLILYFFKLNSIIIIIYLLILLIFIIQIIKTNFII